MHEGNQKLSFSRFNQILYDFMYLIKLCWSVTQLAVDARYLLVCLHQGEQVALRNVAMLMAAMWTPSLFGFLNLYKHIKRYK